MAQSFLHQSYDEYPRVEAAFQAALDESLHPRGREMLYEMVSGLALSRGADVLDLGCGEGQHALRLARDFGFAVHGIDPVARHIKIAIEARDAAIATDLELGDLVRFDVGAAEALAVPDASVDLIWCKDVLVHVESLDQAMAECHRVLRPGGSMLIYHSVFWTNRLQPEEAKLISGMPGLFQTDPQRVEASFVAASFEIAECLELGSEWGEREEEESGAASRRLLHIARLQRAPDRYIAQFGRSAYDIMLGDCLWHVYRMIGKMSPRVYLLRRADSLERA